MRRALVIAAVLATILSGCGASDPADSVEEASTTAEPASTIDEVEVVDDMVFVHGTSGGTECSWRDRTSRRDGDWTVFEGTLMCISEMSDRRVSGVEEWEMKEPFYYTYMAGAPETGRFEASTTLVTDGGIWRGEGFGSDLWGPDGSNANLKTTFFAEYVGEGGYEGLLYRVWGSQHPDSDGYMVVGYITPTE